MVRNISYKTIIIVITSFPIAGDGSEAAGSFVADLAAELARHTKVLVVGPGPTANREIWDAGFEVVRYAAPQRPLSTLKPWLPSDLRWIARVLHGGLTATRAAVGQERHAHIIALWALPCGAWARRVARDSGIPYSVWMLGSDIWTLGRIPIVRNMLARTIQQADRAWADGYKLAEDAQRISGVPIQFLPSTRKILTIQPNPRRSIAPYRLLFLGRWHTNKGVDLLLDALALLTPQDWTQIENVEIQGGGPLDSLVRERVATLSATGHPVQAGRFLTKAEAEAAILRADWVMIPSRIESIPVVFSDAMKLCRPVVAMPVGDLPVLLQQARCGVLAASVNSFAYYQALQTALRIDAHGFDKGMSEIAVRFDLNVVVANFLQESESNA